ncbi:MAG: Dehydrogenase [Ilumatobacteraceae bacterium]|nr:Dehydrogenase [Ilumatobacteraceae bacterium]
MYDSFDTIRPGDPDVIVVGAGIAGLSAALTATEAGRRTLIIDAHGPGGRARTAHHDGFLFNNGPHALYRAGHLHGLLSRHGISMPCGRPDAARVRLLRDGVLTSISLKPTDLMRTSLLSRRNRVRLLTLLASVQRGKPESLVGTSVDDWLGDHPLAVRQFVDMLIRVSSYSNAPATFDAGAALQQLQLALGEGVDYLDGGWEAMVAAMIDRVRSRGGELITGAEVVSIVSDVDSHGGEDRGTVEVHLADRVLRAPSVIIATGGPALAERLTGGRVAGVERLTAPVQAATLDLALNRPHAGLVFGLDRPLYLSPHAPAAQLAPEGSGLVSVMHYIADDAQAIVANGAASQRDRDRLELRSLARLAGITDDDVVHERYSHRLVVVHGAPTEAGGGLRGRPAIDALGVPGVHLAGDWVGPVGLLSDASAASGEAAAIASVRRSREHAA